jgi:uncharacterized membrane protein HdeD (DUF308 family)
VNAVLFGLLAFIWPGLTLVTLVLLYGAFALVDGVISLIAAFTGSAKPVPTWWLVVVGVLGIAAGIVTFAWPGITAILLVLFIGAWALVHGIFEIIGAIQLRKEICGVTSFDAGRSARDRIALGVGRVMKMEWMCAVTGDYRPVVDAISIGAIAPTP